MTKRFLSIWFPYLVTDWQTKRHPELKACPFVFTKKERGRVIVSAVNPLAKKQGIHPGMPAADAKAMIRDLKAMDEIPGKRQQLLMAIGEWCIRFTPTVAVDMPDGLILDISGCAHLWGGETTYVQDIITKLNVRGYHIKAAIADTIGTAWAVAHFGEGALLVAPGKQSEALLSLPPAALRLEMPVLERLKKLGFYRIESLISIPRSVLRRRFGHELLQRLAQALGNETEVLLPIKPIAPYEERLPCLEPIRTARGIEIAIQRLLEQLCMRLEKEGQGIRTAVLKVYRIDNQIVQVAITTTRASHSVSHLFKLFELKIGQIEPALGIELFVLEAPRVEEVSIAQEILWSSEDCGLENPELAELLDRIAGKVGAGAIHRYLPQEHYWPERSVRTALSLTETPSTNWRTERPRPARLLGKPEPIEVTVPLPDYPPMLFVYKGKLHHVKKADGPERIEREWWLEGGEHRDYYIVEDADGARYWLFRSGHYLTDKDADWFVHGFFA